MAQIDSLKTRLEITGTDHDELLLQVLDDAESAILDYTNRDVLLKVMLPLQRELAMVYCNRSSSGGLKSRSEGAISMMYDTEIPADIQGRLNRYRRLKMVGVANAKE